MCYFDDWVSDHVGQEAILDMNYMVLAGIRLDLADGTLVLSDEVIILLPGLISLKVSSIVDRVSRTERGPTSR